MAVERTFAIAKPDSVKDGHLGEIITAIEQSGLKIVGLKLTATVAEPAGGMVTGRTPPLAEKPAPEPAAIVTWVKVTGVAWRL